MMTEEQVRQFMGYLKAYIEWVDEDTDEYEAAELLLGDLEVGLQTVLEGKQAVSH